VSAPTLTVLTGLLAAFVLLFSQARRLYFFGDDWAFLLHRTLSFPQLLEPHNEHWSTLPVVAFRVMFRLVGLDHYLPYALMPIVLHLGVCALAYALMRRTQVPAWPAALATVPYALMAGATAENPLWDFQTGFTGSALLGLVALHLVVCPGWRWTAGAAAVLIVALATSGMAVPMAVWVGVFVLLNDGLRRALAVTLPSAAVFLLWSFTYGSSGTLTSPTPDQVIDFAATGMTAALQSAVRLPGAGTLVLLALVATVVTGRSATQSRALARAGLATLALTMVILGTSRASLGSLAAGAGRYNYFALLMMLPAIAIALSIAGSRLTPRSRQVAAVALVALLGANGVAQTLAFADGRLLLSPGVRKQLIATEQMIHDGDRFLVESISVPYNPDITITSLREPWVRDAIGDGSVGPGTKLDASVLSQTNVSAATFGLPYPDDLGAQGLSGPARPGACTTLQAGADAYLDLPPSESGLQVRLSSDATTYPLQLIGRNGGLSRAVTLPVTVGAPAYVGSTSERGTVRVTLIPGPLEVCLADAD
jgi:hypothetical protein